MNRLLRQQLGLLGTALVFAGCASPPPSQVADMPANYPAGWTADAEASETERDKSLDTQSSGWISDFDSPELRPLINEAIAHNYDLQATAANLSIVGADATIAGADSYPQINGEFDAGRQRQNVGGSSSEFTSFVLGVGASWEIDVWGRLRDRQSAALADVQSALATLRGARLSLAARTANAWFRAIETHQQLELATNTYDSFHTATEAIRQRYERGVSPALDLRLSLAQTAAAKAAMDARGRDLDVAIRELEVLLGRYPARELAIAPEQPQIVRAVPIGLPSELLERRPDLIVAERQLAASGKRVSEARKAMLPRISLTGSYGYSSDALGDLLGNSFSVWSLAGNALQPIFQGMRLSAAVDRARAVAQERLASYGQTALEAFREVETALAAERYLDQRVTNLNESATQSIAAENAAWERYQRGLTDIITVLDSQRRTFEASTALISARTGRLVNRVNLYLALGGDFDEASSKEEIDVRTPLGPEPISLPQKEAMPAKVALQDPTEAEES
ncbi:efflux transporter outer membrane subunit [Cerasicoccus arenae]|uniref:Multidrug transporter n=1 Tax=Cerasicoccus arenae TaxID=424488 RepID=A0A8J3GEZ9_9BACT|nr:efflux transporter outer membrane subunit [Cerasicoccus arenae]MBK1858430.1 efflux transporter outer membrane subunit [Cerasicoccus arenae]GHC02516.1 multidrug transporter [Cerasicoccus arenae]